MVTSDLAVGGSQYEHVTQHRSWWCEEEGEDLVEGRGQHTEWAAVAPC